LLSEFDFKPDPGNEGWTRLRCTFDAIVDASAKLIQQEYALLQEVEAEQTNSAAYVLFFGVSPIPWMTMSRPKKSVLSYFHLWRCLLCYSYQMPSRQAAEYTERGCAEHRRGATLMARPGPRQP